VAADLPSIERTGELTSTVKKKRTDGAIGKGKMRTCEGPPARAAKRELFLVRSLSGVLEKIADGRVAIADPRPQRCSRRRWSTRERLVTAGRLCSD
jgi:hypothetical protein